MNANDIKIVVNFRVKQQNHDFVIRFIDFRKEEAWEIGEHNQ